MKLGFLSLIILIAIPGLGALPSSSSSKFSQWDLVSSFGSGALYKSKDSNKITLTAYQEDGHAFVFNKLFVTENYLSGLTTIREAAFSIGGLKNWKPIKTLEEKKSVQKISLIFKGQYERGDGTLVTLYEQHIFKGSRFYQWQVIANADEPSLDEEMVLKTFEEAKREIAF